MSRVLPEYRKPLKCDFTECPEMVQWYRKYKGKLWKLCTKHEAFMQRQHQGHSIDPKDLTADDWRYLRQKDLEEED